MKCLDDKYNEICKLQIKKLVFVKLHWQGNQQHHLKHWQGQSSHNCLMF